MSKTANAKTAFVVLIVLLACLQAPHAFVGAAAFNARGGQAAPPSSSAAPADGSAWKGDDSRYHTLRGGGWDLPAFFIHSALRGPYDAIHRLGFRLVCLPPTRATRQQAVARQNPPAVGGPPPARDFSRLTGPYLGQTPPGPTPRVFAPNAVSTSAHELNAVFTPEGREFYFTIQGEDRRWTIMRTALENGRWSVPRAASFSGRWSDVDLFITPDGRRLYFCSNRPIEGDAIKDFDIWVCERSGTGWSEPLNLGEPINSPFAEFYPTLTRDGTMYFQSRRPGGHGAADIWRARLHDGRFVEAECLPEPVNSSESEGDAFIAPDESYLIVSAARGASAPQSNVPSAKVEGAAPPPPPPAGLFLSVRKADGTWSGLVSLGDGINTPQAGVNCQMLSPDGRYLFFTRGGDIYWVDAAVIEDAQRRAVGGRYDGGASRVAAAAAARWTPMRSGTTDSLVGVWGASPRDVFVVGTKGSILHFDGKAWAPMSVEGAPPLIAVWGASGSDVFAVGDGGMILHYDGRAWAAVESGTKKNLISVWGTSGRDVYVAGYAGTLLHYDGKAWTPMVTNTTEDLYAVWGTGPNEILAVGGTPMPMPGKGAVLRYDGRAWSPMSIGTSAFLAGVWGSSARDVFAVGVGHTILHYDGQAWTAMLSGTRPAEGKVNLLTRVWGSGPHDVFAVGFDGVLLHYDGKEWAAVPSGTTQSLNTIWGFSPEDIFVVGGGGTILHYGTK